jgi:adenylate kinase family enzyme
MYIQRLIEANEDMEEARRGIREFSHSLAVEKLLDCYFSIVRFELEFKNAYSIDANEVDPYQLMALHVMLLKKQLDIDNLLMMVNKNTVQSNLSILQRLFTDNRAFGEVVSILNKVTDLSLQNKVQQQKGNEPPPPPPSSPMPNGLSRFDMSVAGGFDTIIGQDRAVEKARKLVEESVTVGQPLSIILYGPPGTGKTSVALALGREYKLNVYTVSVASLGGHFIGEREKNTVEIFNYLENRDEDIILFIDEADSFLTAPAPSDSQQTQYTRAVTMELIDRFLKPVKRKDDGKTSNSRARLILMATNFENRIAEDIGRRSVKILIDLPRSPEDMYRLVDFYRQTNRINMTKQRLQRIGKYALRLGLAPSHVSQIMRRIAAQVLLDMLKRGVSVGRYMEFGKRSGPNPLASLVLPVYTVGGTAVKSLPSTRDTVVKLFNSTQKKHRRLERVMPFSGENRMEIPASAVYPYYDGDVERFFRPFNNFDRLLAGNDDDDGDSTEDPEYSSPDHNDDNDDDDDEGDRYEQFGVEYDELRWAAIATSEGLKEIYK